MSERKINLEDLLINHCNNNMLHWINEAEYRKSFLLDAMKGAIKQALELAAENVGFIKTTSEELNSKDYVPFITADDNTIWTFDKQSILDTINQIE